MQSNAYEATWTGSEYVVASLDWHSADGDNWSDATGSPAVGPEFDGVPIRLVGGPRDGEEVA